MKQNDFFEILPNYLKETKDLTFGSKNVLAALLFLNNNEYSKENGFFFRSNEDLIKDSQVSKPTLIKSLNQLEIMGFIERKVGNRKSGASLYKLNENFTQSLKVNFTNNFTNNERVKIEGFTQRVKEDFTNKTLPIENHDKQRDLEENFTNNFTNNFTTDTDTEVDIDIINKLNNNIIILNNNLNKLINILNNKNNIISESEVKKDFSNETLVNEENVTSSETLVNENLESSNKNYIFAKEPLTEETIKKEINHIPTENNKLNETSKENNMIKETSTQRNFSTEKKIIEHFNKENTVKQTPSEHYNIILPSEQKRIFNELIQRMRTSTSIAELTDKHIKMQKYMSAHTFMISYIDQEKQIFKELKEKLNTSTENEFKAPSSPSNVLDGVTAHDKEENASDAKEMPLNQIPYSPMERALRIRAERMEGLKKAIDDATTVEELRNAAKKINAEKNSLSTDEMAELAELMQLKAETV